MGTGSAHAGPGDDSRSGQKGTDRLDPDVTDRSRGGDRSRPTLLVNPPTDVRLRRTLDGMLDEQAPATPAELEALARAEYPRLVVRARSLEHESMVIWYVYREGYWVPATTDDAAAKDDASADAP
jgi:hypothetical protein